MNEQRLNFQDGTVYTPAHLIQTNGSLYLYIEQPGVTLKDLFDVVYDPNRTSRITAFGWYDETGMVYEGYTRLIAVRDEGNGLLTAVLSKPL